MSSLEEKNKTIEYSDKKEHLIIDQDYEIIENLDNGELLYRESSLMFKVMAIALFLFFLVEGANISSEYFEEGIFYFEFEFIFEMKLAFVFLAISIYTFFKKGKKIFFNVNTGEVRYNKEIIKISDISNISISEHIRKSEDNELVTHYELSIILNTKQRRISIAMCNSKLTINKAAEKLSNYLDISIEKE